MISSQSNTKFLTAGFFFLSTVLLFSPAPSFAGSLRNADPRPYNYRIFWDDLSPTEEGEIKPKEEKKFDDKRCTIQLMKQLDNIFVRPHESIVIRDGILQTQKAE